MNPGFITQLEPPGLLRETKPLAIIKNEPPESEVMGSGIHDLPYLSHEDNIPDIKDLDIVVHTLCEDSIKCETVPENILLETNFLKTENRPFVKIENIIESENLYKTEDTSDGQEVVEVQETDEQHVPNCSNDISGISTRSRKHEHPEKTDFTETTLWKDVKNSIKVIKAPIIPVKPHEYITLAEDKHICNQCQHACNKLNNLKLHIRKIHRDVTTMYQCRYCSFKSKWRLSLRKHIIRKHKDPKDTKRLRYRCDMCDYETFIPHNLDMHKLNHLKPEEIPYFYCYHCSYKSKQKVHLKLHISKHFRKGENKQKEKTYQCDKCDYKTFRSKYLSAHQLHHLKPEEIRYFYCYHCSYKSKQKSHLKTHIFRHFKNGNVPFHCYVCDFITLKRELIVDHIKKHFKVEIKSEINEGS